ncbi:MAG: hypothetical protein WBL29_13395 [Burkholderiales bacterium]
MSARRIVLGLDAGTPLRDLEAATALAARTGAELMGLFVEDIALLQFAALPFAHEIGGASAARRSLDVASVERSLRALAAEAERMLAGTAGRSEVRWSFRVARGVLVDVLLAAASDPPAVEPGAEIRLLLLGDGDAPAERWTEHVRTELAGREPAPRVRIQHAASASDLARLTHEFAAPVLIVPVRMLRRP